jgi:hypothetical protein
MKTVVKLVSERHGEHVHDRVFIGPDVDHLALAGRLVFDVGQWQEFGAALLLGSRHMKGRMQVLLEGDEEVADHEDRRDTHRAV